MNSKAKESVQIERARKKIKQQLTSAEKRINTEALEEMSKLIQRQLQRHAKDRISLKDKTVTLFDENQHSAQTESKFVNRLLKQIKQKFDKANHQKKLRGRISVEYSK